MVRVLLCACAIGEHLAAVTSSVCTVAFEVMTSHSGRLQSTTHINKRFESHILRRIVGRVLVSDEP